MARKEYISDHLVDMRDHLKRHYEQFHQKEGAENSAAAPGDGLESSPSNLPGNTWQEVPEKKENDSLPGKDETPANLRYMPSLRKSGDDALARERRELEGRVIHDLAECEYRMAMADNELAELKKFYAVLQNAHGELLKMAESGDHDQLRALQAKYYAANGRWQALESGSRDNSGKTAVIAGEAGGIKAALILSGAIVAGCIIVSLVLIGLFS